MLQAQDGSPYEQRRRLIEQLTLEVEEYAQAVILCGSMAYADPASITDASDVDLLVITENLGVAVNRLMGEEHVEPLTVTRHFDGVCVKADRGGINASIHVLKPDTLQIVALAFVADLRLFRPKAKSDSYDLRSFKGESYSYQIRSVPVPDCRGYRTIVPVGFIQNDVYYVGIHRDKLLSRPLIIRDHSGMAAAAIMKNRQKTYSIFLSERLRSGDASSFEFCRCLAKYDRFSADAMRELDRTLQVLSDRQ